MNTETFTACPKCEYVRKESDTAPDWQCPACGIAIAKYREYEEQAMQVQVAIAAAHEPSEPRLALPNRVMSAAPDLTMAGLFLWCWIEPTAWRPTLASELGSLMLMEFFALHSAMFLGGTASVQQHSIATRLMTAVFVVAFYVPIAGTFAYFHGGWTPMLGFGWLLMTRVVAMLAGQGSGRFESKRMRFYWASGLGYYVVCFIPVLLLPLPRLGFADATGLYWDAWWAIGPRQVISWGFLYFSAMAIIKLWEKPEWIEETR